MSVQPSYTVAVLGPGGVGKTCLILRLTSLKFDSEYIPTIQDYFEQTMKINEKTYKLEIIDTAGQDEMAGITDIGIKNAQSFIIVYSVTSQITFNNCEKFRDKAQQFAMEGKARIVLCANKCDVAERTVTKKMGEDLAREWGVPFFETSAKDGTNVTEAFEAVLITLIPTSASPKDRQKDKEGDRGGCCEIA